MNTSPELQDPRLKAKRTACLRINAATLGRGTTIAMLMMAVIGVWFFSTFAGAQPTLSITPLGSNYFTITVTDTVTTNYTLEWQPVLGGTNYEWQPLGPIEGSNTTVDMGIWDSSWFRVKEGIDGDGDGFPPWIDANDDDPNVGALTVTIDSPLNGATLN